MTRSQAERNLVESIERYLAKHPEDAAMTDALARYNRETGEPPVLVKMVERPYGEAYCRHCENEVERRNNITRDRNVFHWDAGVRQWVECPRYGFVRPLDYYKTHHTYPGEFVEVPHDWFRRRLRKPL